MRSLLACLLAPVLALALSACGSDPEPTGPFVLAAASTQEAMTDAAAAWTAKGHPAPVLSFAGSGALARQVAVGAPADVFLSADEKWMDWLDQEVSLREGSRANLATNSLVLIAPLASEVAFFPAKGGWRKAIGEGRLALADPVAVPAGRYAKGSLITLGVWEEIKDRVAETADVRAALALVGRGDAPLGIVYGSDAQADENVRVVGTFPDESHVPIRYPLAILARSRNPDAEPFRAFLLSEEGQEIFARHGFGPATAAIEP
ncbi:molybdate ABC transporter substrate-binding protein [Croceicoccus bisphenolivorans]|uniref:molybdate ABC transporter substrate-binding protein n=1 Tax=Croceicoccus bisphenolivorans TaxID=1783232 RepID=UPI000830B0F1|nr:molybdate ABC transporter substrate-binding protein [Croceicoccus bisphenolivorans]